MEANKVDLIMATLAEKIPAESTMILRERLLAADDSKAALIQSIELKNPTTLLIISLFLGSYGVDRFMLGDTAMGALKLITCGGCGIWTIIDWFSVQGKARQANLQKIQAML